MNLEISTQSVGLIIFIMALVTLATRWGGVFIMSFIPINDRIQRFIAQCQLLYWSLYWLQLQLRGILVLDVHY